MDDKNSIIADGQIIAIGIDGIREVCSTAEEMFGKAHFLKFIRKNALSNAKVILNAVDKELNQFTRVQRAEDDIILTVLAFMLQQPFLAPQPAAVAG